MSSHSIALYIIILTALVYCPGPMTMFCLATSIKIGPKATSPALLGASSAYIGQLIIVSLGLGLVLQHSVEAFDLLKWMGAAYLIYLGIKQWRASDTKLETETSKKSHYSMSIMYLRGFFVGATNPKSIIIFTALFPQFINPHAPRLPQLLILSALFLVMQFSSASFYTCFGAKVFKWLQQKQKEKLLRRVTGTVLVTAGILLASTKE